MAYRDESEPLQERRASLTRALEQVRAQSRALAFEESALAEEVDRLSARLDPVLPCPRSHGLVVAVLGSAACALLGFAAVSRIMTSEIAPITFEAVSRDDVGSSTVSGGFSEDPSTSTSMNSVADEQLGLLRIDAPPGSLVYEGERFLGTAPLIYPMAYGTHVIRAVPPAGGSQTRVGVVRDPGVSALHFE